MNMHYLTGKPYPLGTTQENNGWNCAIFSKVALSHFVYAPLDNPTAMIRCPLNPEIHQTGHIWHIFLPITQSAFYYGWQLAGSQKIYIDPYAKLLDSGNSYGDNLWKAFPSQSRLFALAFTDSFDWQNITQPQLALSDLIIYEMHVRGFTQHPSSQVSSRGTFQGVTEKIPYLSNLGVTAVEMLPIFEWNEEEYTRINPKTKKTLTNFWGYSPISFFAPMQRFGSTSNPIATVRELKTMIRELHRHGIEVILDIVFNHTGEGNENGPTYSMKAFSTDDYYLIDERQHYCNFSGCGNTVNCNNPVVQDLIIDALRYWATEFKIDGFRFDLASILTRDRSGNPLEVAPLLERITQEAALSNCKLIAEPWDAAGLHQTGRFFQNYYRGAHRWGEWNDNYRSCVRRFIKGDTGLAGQFATKLAGSQDIYGQGGSPLNSINYITSHDGFTLYDLVSYNEKHNIENGENNHDGMNNNDSWNCGKEGPHVASSIVLFREKQVKNYMIALMVSLGIPMIQMGDEYGHSKGGNNNSWCQDTNSNYFLWDHLETSAIFSFVQAALRLRKTEPLLKTSTFLEPHTVSWHGTKPLHPCWDETTKFIAYTLHDLKTHEDLYIAFNASHLSTTCTLAKPHTGYQWHWLINTASHPKQNVSCHTIKIEKYSCIVLKQLPENS